MTRYLTPSFAVALAACSFSASPLAAQQGNPRQVESILTSAGPVQVIDVTGDLEYPWGMAFLPDGRVLVTERMGKLRIVDRQGNVSMPIGGTPRVYAQGQGGLMDVALDPDYAREPWIYLSYAKPGSDGMATTALGRGKLRGDSIVEWSEIFRQEPWIDGPNHFGNRIVFDRQGHLILALGERFQFEPAQDSTNHLGTIVRLNKDGSVPRDNPFVNRQGGARPEIWSYGHRNIESAAIHPVTGALWVAEMGPMGGDELNMPERGRNYGWPRVSRGRNYDATTIPAPSTMPRFAGAAKYWTPVISPSGMAFYTGSAFPQWRNSALIGGLSRRGVIRVPIDGTTLGEEEFLPLPERIRDVEVGPDGHVYVLTDGAHGHLWRMQPMPVGPGTK